MNLKHTLSLLVLIAAPAFPTTITFGTGGTAGFTGGGVNSVTVNNVGGYLGLTLTVTAGVLSPASCAPQCWLTTSSAGYGVDNSAPAGGATDSSQDLDGSGNIDTITLVFNHAVVLSAMTFGNFSAIDDGELYNTTASAVLVSAFNTSSISGLNAHGTTFRLQAVGSNDAFRLESVTFAPNPEPGTWGLAGIGLIALLAAGRKRKQRTAAIGTV